MGIFFKQIIICLLIVLALLAIYFGSIAAWIKSTDYITAIQNMTNVHSMTEFQTNFDKPLQFPSPIGQEEVVKFLSSDISGLITQDKQPENVDRALVDYIQPQSFTNDVRHLMVMGQMYLSLAQQFGHAEDFQKAEDYYLKARAIGPKLPPVLYGLLTIYQAENNLPKFKEVAETILSYWPNDPQLGTMLPLLNATATMVVSSTKK